MELLEIEGESGTSLRLNGGVVLVSVQGSGSSTISVLAPSGVLAKLAGSLMGVYWDPVAGQFEVDCFGAACEIVFPGGVAMGVSAGQRIVISSQGEVLGPLSIDPSRYAFGQYAGGLVLAATPEPVLAGGSGAQPSRTPLGPLFVSPTPPPPTRTPKPPPPPPPGPAPTQPPPPTDTPVPPTDTPVPPPTHTDEPPPTNPPATDPPAPTSTDEPPGPTATPGD